MQLYGDSSLTSLIIDGGVDEGCSVTVGERGRVVVLKGYDVDILAVGTSDLDLTSLSKGVVEVLNLGVKLLVEAALDTLEDVVGRRLVTRKTEGTVAAIVLGNLVQVPEVALESR